MTGFVGMFLILHNSVQKEAFIYSVMAEEALINCRVVFLAVLAPSLEMLISFCYSMRQCFELFNLICYLGPSRDCDRVRVFFVVGDSVIIHFCCCT